MRSPARPASTPCSSATAPAQRQVGPALDRRRHSRRLPSHRTDRDLHRLPTSSGTRPTLPAFAAPGSSPPSRPKKAAAGPRASIKALTGGDTHRGALHAPGLLRVHPQFKLVIAGNHKPGLRSVDEAIRRRFHLIPFPVIIPDEERDPDLAEAEGRVARHPGLGIRGCGLAPPEAVRAATAAYLEAEDALMAWVEECCGA